MKAGYIKKSTALSVTQITNESQLEQVQSMAQAANCTTKSTHNMTRMQVNGTAAQLQQFANRWNA